MEMKALLKRLVETESPTSDKAAVDCVGAIVADEARRLGADVELVPVMDVGNHLITHWNSGKGGILLMYQMDTVSLSVYLLKCHIWFFGRGIIKLVVSVQQKIIIAQERSQ